MTQAVIDAMGVSLFVVGLSVIVWVFADGMSEFLKRAFR
jgi:hypothetical protein